MDALANRQGICACANEILRIAKLAAKLTHEPQQESTMVKRIVLTVLQFLIFIGLLAVGGNWDVINLTLQIRAMENHTTAFNPIPVIKTQISSGHILIADGLIFATVLLLIILLIEALRKKLKPWAALSILAFVLALFLGFAMKLGLPPAPTPDSASPIPAIAPTLQISKA